VPLNSRRFKPLLARSIYCLSILLTVATLSFSQSRKADSLRTIVRSSSGIKKADALNRLSFLLLSFDTKYFSQTSDEALRLCQQLGYEKGIAEATILSGINEYTIGNKTLSDRYIKEGIRISSKIDDRGLWGYGITQLGINFQFGDQPDSALRCFQKAYVLLQDSLHPYYLSRVHLAMADYYGVRGEHDLQLKYLNRCLQIRELLKDESVTWLLVRIASYYTDQRDLDLAMASLDRAQKSLGSDTVNNETISEIHSQRAIVYFKKGKFSKALDYIYSARKFYENNSHKQELTNLLLNTGLVFDSMDNYDLSLRNYFDALTIADVNHFTLETIKLEYAISWSYLRLGQIDLSTNYAIKSLRHAEKNNHSADVASALNLLGMIKGNQNKNREALEDLNKALTLRRRLQDNPGQATTLFNIGTLYEKLNKLDSSLMYQRRSLAIRESSNDEEAMADSWQLMGRLLTKLGDFKKAEYYLDKAEKKAKQIKVSYILLNTFETRRELLKTESLFEKALQYSILYENLRDSIFTTHLSNRLSILENIYHLQEKEQEIQLLNQQQKLQLENLTLQSSEIRQQRLFIFFIAGILILVCAVTIIIFRYYRKVRSLNEEITHQNQEIQKQAEKLTTTNSRLAQLNGEIILQKQEIQLQSEELASSNETISAINQTLEERIQTRTLELKQAYRELDTFFYRASHDFRRPLTTFMGLAEVAKITIHDPASLELFEKVNDTARSLDKMVFKLQSISDVGTQELVYKEVNLKALCELEIDKFWPEIQKGHVQVELFVKLENPFLSYPSLLQIIISNLLENAINFNNKTDPHVWLTVVETDHEISIEVRDNGEGIPKEYNERVFEMYFRASERSKGNGLGLYIVKKTVQKLNGRLEMTSAPEQGTTVRVFLPKRQISF
jgi:signal transduction histidine kinase